MNKIIELKQRVLGFPLEPGVYLMKNAKAKVIYVGKAKNLRSRVKSYFHENVEKTLKTKFLVSHIDQIEYILTRTEVEAFLLEASLIKKYRPRYNIRLKDDKAYPYVRCSVKDDFPRFYLVRKVQSDGALYFGPYTSGLAVRETIRFLNRTFKIRDCKDAFMVCRTRPCMTYQIGRCTAPCVGLVDKESYGRDFRAALEFLRGRHKSVVRELNQRMKQAVQLERFEAAAKIRDSLAAIEAIWEKQAVVHARQDRDQDVIGFVGDEEGTLIEIINVRGGRLIGRQGHFFPQLQIQDFQEDTREWFVSFLNQYYADNFIPDEIITQVDLGSDIKKLFEAVLKERGKIAHVKVAVGEDGKRLLEIACANAQSRLQDIRAEHHSRENALKEIQSRFQLPFYPKRIECFDVSHIQGSQIVASQVVCEDGLLKKNDYRLYKVKTVSGTNDDFASMKEVLSRRFRHTEYETPQLVVVDGGKGQLKMAREALLELGQESIPVVGLAKARVQGNFSDTEVKLTQERFFIPGRQNPVTFPPSSKAFQILVGLRDEAHRFALSFHRQLRGHESLSSVLDQISGLGPKRKKLLLQKFKTLEAMRLSTVEDLLQVPSLSRVLAERILKSLSQISSDEVSRENI